MLAAALHTLRLVLARSSLYFGCVAVATFAQAAIVLIWTAPEAIDVATSVVLPILSAVIYAFTRNDARAENAPAAQIWARILERTWAVIVIDFILNSIIVFALASSGTNANIAGVIAGGLLLFLTAILLFADVSATIDDGDGTLMLIPRSVIRSVTAALYPGNMLGAVAIVSLELMLTILEGALQHGLIVAHIPHPLLWASVPLSTLAAVPISAYTTLLYLRTQSKKPPAI
ncbi:MAG: hypothetical protein ACYDGM_01340 [Vulcanimicrobiaceae bacterium]